MRRKTAADEGFHSRIVLSWSGLASIAPSTNNKSLLLRGCDLTFFKRLRPYLLLMSQSILIYGISLSYPLLYWDDFKHICENNFINPPTWSGFLGIWENSYFGMYIPLTYTFWSAPVAVSRFLWPALECVQWGAVFHLFSLCLHVANSILVFRILYKISDRHIGSLLGAALFCGHPMQVEAVAWVSGARDLLSAFLGLYGVLCYLNDAKKTANVLMVLAILAKPSGIVFPVLAAAFSWREWRTHLKYLSPAILAGFVTFVITRGIQGTEVGFLEIPAGFRIPLMLGNLGFYLWKFIWPMELVPMYPLSMRSVLSDPFLLWPAIIPLVLLVFLIRFRQRVFWPAVAWVVIAVLPVSGIVAFGFQEISVVADRYFYLPLVGIAMSVAIFLDGRYQRLLALFAIALFSALSLRQVGFWKNDETIFTHTIEINPQAVGAYSSLGFYYMRQQRLGESEAQFRKALDRDRRHLSSWLGLGRILEFQGRNTDAENVYRAAIENQSAVPEVLNNLGGLLYLKGELAESEKYYTNAAQAAPLYMEPRYNLGQIYLDTGRYKEALGAFQAAAQVAPGSKLVHEKIEEARQKLGAR